VLKQNPDIDILVEGHTDTDGTAAQNWDLSVSRATAVVKILTGFGVDPKKVTAAGRSFFFPVASNDTAQGKALNRRTEVILSPNLDELFELINRKQD
jgi:chemotaxis protein MotB